MTSGVPSPPAAGRSAPRAPSAAWPVLRPAGTGPGTGRPAVNRGDGPDGGTDRGGRAEPDGGTDRDGGTGRGGGGTPAGTGRGGDAAAGSGSGRPGGGDGTRGPSPGAPPGAPEPRRTLAFLGALTLFSGLLDAITYVGLGHVFVANMTGNVVVLGFAAAGAPGFSAAGCGTALAGFVAGSAAGGRLARRWRGGWRHWWTAVLAVDVAGAAVALLLARVLDAPGAEAGRIAVIGALGLALGCRNASVRSVGVPDMTTTVVTMTLTGLAADSRLAGGPAPRSARRTVSAVLMCAGAVVGALLLRGPGLSAALGAAAAGPAVLLAVHLLSGRRASRPGRAGRRRSRRRRDGRPGGGRTGAGPDRR